MSKGRKVRLKNQRGGLKMVMYFEESGNKAASTIVFIHGGGISGWMWGKQVDYFKEYHCLVPDLPEHGKSINEGKISIRDSAHRIAELIEKHASGGKAHVVGHSLGAKVVVELLSIRPDLIDHAIVASALFKPVPLMKLTHKPFVYKLTTSLLKIKWLTSLTVKQFNFPNKIYEDNCIREFQGMTADTLYRIYDELYQNLNLPAGLQKANVPTLVIAGEKELKAMRQSVAEIVDSLPNAKGILIKNGSHTYPWVLYDDFNKIVEAWISNMPIINQSVISL
jgi:pimeloyl-ACP methyl ester carboxylesterase